MSAIRVELQLEDGSFTTRLIHAGESIQRFNQNVARSYPHLQKMAQGGQLVFTSLNRAEGSAKGFLGTMRDLTVVAGGFALAANKVSGLLNGFVGDIVKVNASFEKFTMMLASMSTAADPVADATKKMQAFRDMSKQVPVSLDAIMNTATKLTAVGIDPLNGSMQSLIDGVAAFGGSEEALNRATLAITQMAGKGVIQMEELRQQLGEAMPRAIELMARSMGASLPEFMEAVSKGTVDARQAIAMFSEELDRTYGGRAAMMLKTFEGQLQRTKALFQDLALTVGQDRQESGFFAGLKDGLKDFNDFLAGTQAKNIAQMLGQGLGTALQGFRQLIDIAIEYQGTIERVTIALGLFAAAMVGRGMLSSALGYWQNLTAQVGLFRAQMTMATTQMATMKALSTVANMNSIGVGAGGLSAKGWAWPMPMNSMAAGATTAAKAIGPLSVAMTGLRTILPALGTGILGVGTALITLGPILLAGAELLGLWGDAADDAVKSAERFGVANLQQYNELATTLSAKLEQLKKDRARLMTPVGRGDGSRRDDLAAVNEEIAALESKLKGFYKEGLTGTTREAVTKQREAIQEQIAQLGVGYDEQMRLIDQREKEKVEAAAKTGEDIKKIQDESDTARLKAMADRALKEKAIYDQQLANARTALRLGDDEQKAIATAQLPFLTEASAGKAKEYNDIQRRLRLFIPVLQDVGTEGEKAFQKLQDSLNDTKDDIASAALQLKGVSKEMAKLRVDAARGKYGSPGDPNIKKIIEQMQFALEVKKELDKALDVRNSIRDSFSAEAQKLKDQMFEIQTKGMTDGEKWKLQQLEKLKSLPPGMQLNLQIDQLKTGLSETSEAAKNAATSLIGQLFGTEAQNGATTLIGLLDQIVSRIQGIGGAITGVLGAAGTAMGSFSPAYSGGGYTGGGSLVDAIIGAESSYDPRAKNPKSSATGLGQFIEDTWLSFINEMKPQFANLSRAQQLALRNDPGLSREATGWYAQKNAAMLQQNGIQPTNGNLYLSHFLGPGDAIKVLSEAITTPLEQLLTSDKIAANPFLMGKTAGWLQDWANKKVGNSQAYDPNAKQIPTAAAPTKEQVAAADTANRAQIDVGAKELDVLREQLAALQRSDFSSQQKKQLEDIALSATGASTAVVELTRQIKDGEWGADTNPQSDKYKEMFDWVKKVDAAQAELDKKNEARSNVDNAMEERKRKVEEYTQALQESANGPDPFAKHKQSIQELSSYYDKLIADAKMVYGVDSQMYKGLVAEKSALIKMANETNFNDTMSSMKDMMSQTDSAYQGDVRNYQQALAQKKAELDKLLAYEGWTAEQRAALQGQANQVMVAQQQAMAQQIRANDPFSQQMQQWADLSQNTSQFMASAIDGLSNALTDLIMTGKADWKGLVDSLLRDATKLAIQFAFGSMFGGKGGMGGMKGGMGGMMGGMKGGGKGAAGAVGGAAKLGGGKKGMLMGIFHEGGIVGSGRSRARFVNPAVFLGAKKFHTGGLVGGGLAPGEVPIIAQKGEGIFTKDQMRSMAKNGGGQNVSLTSNVTVNASGGTPEQNDDLAKKVSSQVEGSIRGLVAKELRTQMRPGGMMAR